MGTQYEPQISETDITEYIHRPNIRFWIYYIMYVYIFKHIYIYYIHIYNYMII